MDPETGLDGVRNVGVSGGKIVRISTEPLTGARVIDATVWWLRPVSSICTNMGKVWTASA